jgi:hypothetical protein
LLTGSNVRVLIQLVENGRFLNESYSLEEFMRMNAMGENRWKGTGVPEDFIKCVLIAVAHHLLMMRRARILCDAYTAGHTGVLRAWEDHVRMPDVVNLLDRLRAFIVTEFAVQDAAAAKALDMAKRARKLAKEARRRRRNEAEMRGPAQRSVVADHAKVLQLGWRY